MAQVNRGNLGFLGEPFQYRLAHEFMESHTFFEDLSGIVDQNMFTDPNLKVFVGMLKNYYERVINRFGLKNTVDLIGKMTALETIMEEEMENE